MSSKLDDAPAIFPRELVQWLELHRIVAEVHVSHADGSALDEATLAQLQAQGNRMAERRSHLERLASMGEVSASMAHEARNVLAGINGLCQLKTAGGTDERTQLIRSEIERCTRLLPGAMVLDQPMIPAPIPFRFPFPNYATRADELPAMDESEVEEAFTFL